ncbi:hypothetical protein PYCCODRAFT_377333 [Trametes coccinea BRFM310]|uniref:Uncharacterized protein n=1 Tax=Trametes coccinea (strain BRFM310) TaxID=1353009 RepID=A0A1Y2J3Q2_TRAC3|nr:hypothetical protein PYCCODRAFT_377333 [Trametes coccinea BRFM310]
MERVRCLSAYAYDKCSAECRQLSEELERIKNNQALRALESRQFYLHELSGAKDEPVAILKDSPDHRDATKVTIVCKDNVYQLSPVPPTEPIPDLPSTLLTFEPLTDDLDEPEYDDRRYRDSNVSASRAIPIQPSNAEAPRSRSHSSMLAAADPDAMAISLPRNTLDVHMASVSSSPMVSTVQYSSRPAEFISSSLGRVPENALGLRAASPSEISPSAVDHELLEQQRRAQLRLGSLSPLHTQGHVIYAHTFSRLYHVAIVLFVVRRQGVPRTDSEAAVPPASAPAPATASVAVGCFGRQQGGHGAPAAHSCLLHCVYNRCAHRFSVPPRQHGA